MAFKIEALKAAIKKNPKLWAAAGIGAAGLGFLAYRNQSAGGAEFVSTVLPSDPASGGEYPTGGPVPVGSDSGTVSDNAELIGMIGEMLNTYGESEQAYIDGRINEILQNQQTAPVNQAAPLTQVLPPQYNTQLGGGITEQQKFILNTPSFKFSEIQETPFTQGQIDVIETWAGFEQKAIAAGQAGSSVNVLTADGFNAGLVQQYDGAGNVSFVPRQDFVKTQPQWAQDIYTKNEAVVSKAAASNGGNIYETRTIDGQQYKVIAGTQADWKPGQAMNVWD